jgi:hypothetical protein
VFTFGELLSLAAAQSVDTDAAAPLWKKLHTHQSINVTPVAMKLKKLMPAIH